MRLDMPVQYIKGVGPERAKEFAKLGIHTVEDLLNHFPFRWEFFKEPLKIAEIRQTLESLQQEQDL